MPHLIYSSQYLFQAGTVICDWHTLGAELGLPGWEVQMAPHASTGLGDGGVAGSFPFVKDICVGPGARPRLQQDIVTPPKK